MTLAIIAGVAVLIILVISTCCYKKAPPNTESLTHNSIVQIRIMHHIKAGSIENDIPSLYGSGMFLPTRLMHIFSGLFGAENGSRHFRTKHFLNFRKKCCFLKLFS